MEQYYLYNTKHIDFRTCHGTTSLTLVETILTVYVDICIALVLALNLLFQPPDPTLYLPGLNRKSLLGTDSRYFPSTVINERNCLASKYHVGECHTQYNHDLITIWCRLFIFHSPRTGNAAATVLCLRTLENSYLR